MPVDLDKLNPGSYSAYLERTDQAHGTEAIQGYSDSLHAYRLGRAAMLGLSLEELHRLPCHDDSLTEVSATL